MLLGTWDLVHRIVYVADTIPAPSDSRKRETSFIRGCEGLLDKVTQAGKLQAACSNTSESGTRIRMVMASLQAAMTTKCFSGFLKRPRRMATSQLWPSWVSLRPDGLSNQLASNRM